MRDIEALVAQVAYANIVAPLLLNAYGALFRRRLEKRGVDAHEIDFGAGDPALEAYDPTPHLARLAERVADSTRSPALAFSAVSSGWCPAARSSWSASGTSPIRATTSPRCLARGSDAAGVATGAGRPASRILEGQARACPRPCRVDGVLARRTSRYRFERERVSYTYTRGYGQFRPAVLEMARRLVERGSLDDIEDVFMLTRSELEPPPRAGCADLRSLAGPRRAEIARLRDVEMPETIFGDDFDPAPPADPTEPSRAPPALAASGARGRGSSAASRRQPVSRRATSWSSRTRTWAGHRCLLAPAASWPNWAGCSRTPRSWRGSSASPAWSACPGRCGSPTAAIVRVDGFTGDITWEPATPWACPGQARLRNMNRPTTPMTTTTMTTVTRAGRRRRGRGSRRRGPR